MVQHRHQDELLLHMFMVENWIVHSERGRVDKGKGGLQCGVNYVNDARSPSDISLLLWEDNRVGTL